MLLETIPILTLEMYLHILVVFTKGWSLELFCTNFAKVNIHFFCKYYQKWYLNRSFLLIYSFNTLQFVSTQTMAVILRASSTLLATIICHNSPNSSQNMPISYPREVLLTTCIAREVEFVLIYGDSIASIVKI